MNKIKAILINNIIELIFPYDISIISQVKQIPGRVWNPFPINRWTVPYNKNSVNSLIDIGFDMKDIVKDINQKEEQKHEEYKQQLINLKKEFPFLYNYQIEAVAKGIINKKLYLADVMGLGKMLMSSSITEHFMNNNTIQKTFILCPSTIIQQWIDEMKKFHKQDYFPITSKYNQYDREQLYYEHNRIITTYDLITNDLLIVQPLVDKQGLILDEATKIKNPSTRRYKAISQLSPLISVFNSGTPYETKLTDVYNVCNVLHKGWMTKYEYYGYCDYDKDLSLKYPVLLGYKNLDKFAERFNEIGIKRNYEDVCSEAPIMTHYNHIIPQNKEQLKIQELIKQETSGDFIASATLLQMLSSHPSLLQYTQSPLMRDIIEEHNLFDKAFPKLTSPKLLYLKELLDEHDDNKIVIFSRFIEMKVMIETFIRDLPEQMMSFNIDTINIFKKYKDKSILILGDSSIYGVDIPEASMLINFDILWNPAKMEQRNARIHRISSKHNIKIINLISEGIEQYMFDYNQQCKQDGTQATNINKLLESFIKG